MNKADLILSAAMSKFRAQKEEATAVLMVLATSSVGLSEHTKIVEEFAHWTRVLAEAEECIKTLRTFTADQSQES